jgi:hypothetical protein
MHQKGTLTDRSLKLISMLISVALLLSVTPRIFAANDLLDDRYVRLTNSAASLPSSYTFGFRLSELSTPVGSISFEFCSNSPIIGDPCVPIAGFDTTTAVFSTQQGEAGFALSGSSTSERIILTRPAALPTGNPAQYIFTNIANPSADGSYYVRIQTFTSTDATGQDIESGGVVFATVQGLSISTEVPPYLRFCAAVTIVALDCSTATSYLIDLGEFSSSQTAAASSEMLVATNAASGYSITVAGTTLTSGNNIIPALAGVGSIKGVSQFGINLRSNSNPSIGANPIGPGVGGLVTAGYNSPNAFRFQQGDILVSSPGSSDNQKFTISYITNVSSGQAPGYYATTMTYICLANF